MKSGPVKPFLLLSIRAEPEAAAEEQAAFVRCLDVGPRPTLQRRQLGPKTPLDCKLDLDDWSGILLGGGAFTGLRPRGDQVARLSDRAEADLRDLLDDVVAADFPFLGPATASARSARMRAARSTRAHPEGVGPLAVDLTDAGPARPALRRPTRPLRGVRRPQGVAVGGPRHVTVLATSATCPVQAFRVGANVYATQFHPELDLSGLCTRINIYATFGYFEPSLAADLCAAAAAR